MSEHAIKVTISDGGPATAQFVCNAGEHAECHYYCPLPSCDEGCVDRSAHAADYKHFHQCGLMAWLEEGGTWDEQYEGPPAEVHSGQIELVWKGDYYCWRYTAEPAS